ncbi:hypothetical protein Elgi_67310 [Paenibacillus elgii]|uniref:nSTAND3 domain-containing NTPase n=1 Tax=Paenibacillus elgii TaxID=189691 RepID=UPI002D7CA0B7|nr:hypothetical protein Elgi_67310 [Paenibacillus elgii]
MSIELTGPQGYDYQYIQTVYLALLMWEHDGLELIVEKKDAEDAELHFVYDGKNVTIETQVKSEKGTLGIDSLVKWVGHFPDQQSAANLLHRMQNNPHRLVLFVTRSRCSDDTQTFHIPIGKIQEHPRSPLKGRLADTFLDAYSKAYEETRLTPLKQRRDAYCKKQAQQLRIDKATLRELSRRILIWERADITSVEVEVIRLLKFRHHIPEHTARTVISELEKAVREARDGRKNVIPLMRGILEKYAGNRAFSRPVHVSLEGSDLLLRELEIYHVLLLTGISFCGKSHMAEWIGEQLRTQQGFTYLKVNQIDQAYRYLTAASCESRICFLEDPFGHTMLDKDALNAWTRLNAFIEQLAPHRKLIVTSRKDLLQILSGSPSPEAWSMGAITWRDMTVENPMYAIEVWAAYSKLQRLPDSVREIVVAGMAEDTSAVLQPGQIRHLAFSERLKLIDKSFSELSSLAKVDAVQLGQSFHSRQPTELILLITMVLGSSVGSGILERNLFGLLQTVYDELRISEGMIQARTFCEELERAGYIVYAENRWMFAHPTYYEAAMYVAETQGRFGQQRLLVTLRHLIASGVVDIMLYCIRSFGRLYEAYREEDFRREVREMALLAFSGPYPTLRDEILVLLTARIEELQTSEVRDVMKYIEKYHYIGNKLEWYDGVPRLKDTQTYAYQLGMSDTEEIKGETFYAIAKRLRSPEEASSVFPEEAWRLARVLDDHHLDAEVKLPLLKQLLTYKEAFIREAAAFVLLHEYGEEPKHIDLVLGDSHPFVVLQGIQGCFQGWTGWDWETRERVQAKLQEVLTVKVNCVASHEFMTKFSQKPGRFRLGWGRMSLEEREDLIRLWGTLLPVFLEHVPDEFLEIDEAYLFESTTQAASLFTEDQVVRITEAWIGWMDRMIKHRLPNDYGMGFLDFLLDHTSESIAFREGLAVRLMYHQDSYVVSMSLAEYINYWLKLHPQERGHALAVLQSGRSDVRWLRAIALTRNEVPTEICDLLLGDPMALALPLSVTKLISQVDTGLLTDAIEVYGAEHGEMYNLVGRSLDYRWPCIVLELLKHPEHPSFSASLSIALKKVINASADEGFKDQVIQSCTDICRNGPPGAVKLMTNHMLRWTVMVNGADSRSLWENLYDFWDEEKIAEITIRLSDVIECISLNCDSPVELLGDRAYAILLDYHLPSDKMIWILERMHGFNLDGILAYLDLLFEQVTPRIHLSYEIVKDRLRHSEDDGVSALLSKVEKLRKQLITTASEKKTTFYHKEPLEGWVEMWKEHDAPEQEVMNR